MMRCAAAAVVCLLAGTALYAQQPTGPVLLDVVVEGGRQRAPLTAADFTVRQDGQVLAVTAARLVQPTTSDPPVSAVSADADEETAAAAADRLVAVFVDEYHLGNDAEFAAARTALASFIRTGLGPRDLVVVLKPLDSLISIRLTHDVASAARVVEGAAGRQDDYTPRSSLEQELLAGAPARIDAARRQIALSTINALALHLARFPAGRKTLIVLSNGFAAPRASRGEQALPGVDSIVRAANRGRVGVYPFRPSPAATTASDTSADAAAQVDPFATMAEQTTGFVVAGGAQVARGLVRVLHDASQYYLLTVTPPERTTTDGRFRPVTVDVRAPGSVVRARAGYALAIPAGASTAFRIPALPAGLKVPRHASTLIRPWFGQAATADPGRTAVSFVWEAAPTTPGQKSTAPPPARIVMTVTTMNLEPVFSGESAATGRDLVVASADRTHELTFDAAPGTLLVQMQITDATGRVLDRDVRDLVIQAFAAPISFGTAAVYRARTVPELRAITDGLTLAPPIASRQFSRTEHLVVRIPVASRDAAPTLAVRLKNAAGGSLRELPVTAVGTSANLFQVDVPLAGFASGNYALEFTARNGSASIVGRLDFTVTP